MKVLVEHTEYRTTKGGKEYLWVSGNSGEVRKPIYIWGAPPDMDLSNVKFKVINFLRIEDKGDYQSAKWGELVIDSIDIEPEDSILRTIKLKGDHDSESLIKRLRIIVEKRELPKFWTEFVLSDSVLAELREYEKYPAGAKVHHPWVNGLSTHIEEVLTAYMQMSKIYYLNNIKHHVCIIALLFHDWGKIKEYSLTSDWSYTEDMHLFGHIYLGAKKVRKMLETFLSEYQHEEGFDPNEIQRDFDFIEHAILAHHGTKEYGSPVIPATVEAYMVHIADLISARANMFEMAMHMEKNFYLGTTVVKK